MTKILETQNEEWGFWGTAKNILETEQDLKDLWTKAAEIIQAKAGFTPQETLALMDSRWGRHVIDEFSEELRSSPSCFLSIFERRMTKNRLYGDYNYYIDPTAYKVRDTLGESFSKQLELLSRHYGVVLQVVGGVRICDKQEMKNFRGYTSDLECGDLLPLWKDEK